MHHQLVFVGFVIGADLYVASSIQPLLQPNSLDFQTTTFATITLKVTFLE